MKTVEYQRKILADNIQRLLDKNGKTQTDMARELGIPETTVSSWLNAKKYPRIDKVQLMADYFNVRRSEITEEKEPKNIYKVTQEFVHIPVLGEIACGEPILAKENFTGYKVEPKETLPSGNLYYLKAKGESMEPTVPDGSMVLIRQQPDVENNEIAAVLVNGDNEATLKRIIKQGNSVVLMPDNPKFTPYIVNEDNPARIIGKAIRYTREL